jgi:hypothetical protein
MEDFAMKRSMNFRAISGIAALLACAAFAHVASAQLPEGPVAPPPQTAPPERAPSKEPLDETKIGRFADAYIVIEEIQRDTAEKLSEITDSNKASREKEDADKRIDAAIRRVGLDPAEFDRIAQRMASDDALKKKIAEEVAQRRGL